MTNIEKLPDKKENENAASNYETGEEKHELMNVAELAFGSPNPNFIVLDRDILENIDDGDSSNQNDTTDKNTNQTITESEA